MIKNKIDYKLINCALIMLIIFLLYKTGGLWSDIVSKMWDISLPFLVAFIIAYALHPILRILIDNKIPKTLAIIIILVIMFSVLFIFGMIVLPLLFSQLGSLFNGIISFLNELNFDYDINIGNLKDTLSSSFDTIITKIGSYVSNGTLNVIGNSLSFISKLFICFAASIYMLVDMDNYRKKIRNFLNKRSKKIYKYVSLLDSEMHSYLSGFVRIMIISLFEYTFAYTIIGHPDAVLLGCLAMVANLIPYFGGMINNSIAAITAFVISPTLFIKTIILFVILSIVDGNIINPLVYGKTNKVPPLIVIMSVFAGGALFGIIGIVLSLPCAIIILATLKYFKEDVKDKLEDIKEKSKE